MADKYPIFAPISKNTSPRRRNFFIVSTIGTAYDPKYIGVVPRYGPRSNSKRTFSIGLRAGSGGMRRPVLIFANSTRQKSAGFLVSNVVAREAVAARCMACPERR